MRTNGIVKFFNKDSGFGFIEPEDGSPDVFVHKSDLDTQYLIDGQNVEFELIQGNRGPKAKNVKVVPKN